MLRVVFSRLKHHASLVFGIEAFAIPLMEVLIFFGFFAKKTVFDLVVEVRTVHPDVFILGDVFGLKKVSLVQDITAELVHYEVSDRGHRHR